uniref:transposase n=1 Tax=Escherichia coli TaxID=562 RepID=UPI0033145E42
MCRYISRPAVSEKRLSLTRGGTCATSSRRRTGRHHARHFRTIGFIARLAALVPSPEST